MTQDAVFEAKKQQKRKQNARLYLIRTEEKSLASRRDKLMKQRAELRIAEYDANQALVDAQERHEKAEKEARTVFHSSQG